MKSASKKRGSKRSASKSSDAPADVAAEYRGSRFGDERIDNRYAEVGATMSGSPGSSFPTLFKGAAQEGLYRLLRNPEATLARAIEPHAEATVARMAAYDTCLVLHDTTECVFNGAAKEGLTELRPGTYGFNVHLSLAVTADGRRHPLGVLDALIIDHAKSHRDRWTDQAFVTEERVSGASDCIHVADREADFYKFLALLLTGGLRYVVRARHDRLLAEIDEQKRTLLEQLEHAPEVAEREVPISERRVSKRKAFPDQLKARPPRNSRIARLTFRAAIVTLRRPDRQDKDLPATLKLNVVHVREVDAPEGVEPIDWMLATTEPIETREQILAVVDAYRARWLIEEYFKALKTGCNYESRQLESYQTLSVALGLFVPLAWHLLLLRSYGRSDEAPARVVIEERRLKILRALTKKQKHHLPDEPTAREVMLAVAALGGHIKQNGEPGWQVLWRGYKQVIDAERFYDALRDTDL